MKKVIAAILSIAIVFSLGTSVLAAETSQKDESEVYTIVVNDQILNLDDLPIAPYHEGDSIMVPLRKIGEALGYTVGWDAESGAITMEDNYIQKSTLYHGTAAVVFEGKLKVIDMSRKIENAAQTIVHNGYTYVPLEFFQEFFNDTAVDGYTITIAPSMSELHTAME
jgi:hypothetical protein